MKHLGAKTALVLSTAFTIGTATANDTIERNAMSHQLVGTFEYQGRILGAVSYLDTFKQKGNRIYVQPEDYKIETFSVGAEQQLGNAVNEWFKLSCPSLDGPGIRALEASTVNSGVDCTYISGNGSNRVEIPFKMYAHGAKTTRLPEAVFDKYSRDESGALKAGMYRGKNSYKMISGQALIDGVSLDVSAKFLMLDYRNGNNHKVFARSNADQGKLTFAKSVGNYKVRLLSCDNGLFEDGQDVHANSAPKSTCSFMITPKRSKFGPMAKTVNIELK